MDSWRYRRRESVWVFLAFSWAQLIAWQVSLMQGIAAIVEGAQARVIGTFSGLADKAAVACGVRSWVLELSTSS